MMNNVTDVDVQSGVVKGTRRRPRINVAAAKTTPTPVTTVRLDRCLHDALADILRPGETFRIVDASTVVTYYR